MMGIGRFLGGVGALVWDPALSRYLILRRASDKDFAAGAWECITGRVDQGEGFEDAVRREVREEAGIEVVLDFILGTTHFHRGLPSAETELIGVIYHCSRVDTTPIEASAEHDAFRWVTVQEALAMLDAGNPTEVWLRRLMARAEALRMTVSEETLRFNREFGFEIG